ncbi:PAS domain-containing sensor histidine kinase [Sandaracinus amylolyticus]|uniref:histidine kinase n=1 Tax=Sandaracinus amylolyticus TaxID=927083 RepID=A0A0F6SE17_9BACT|nr:PAS domain S-box protein [Sandaracinus amylolyticus]AKF04414.1 Signal transduction histidine kinase CheA [Sandaracinus amylolyticus]
MSSIEPIDLARASDAVELSPDAVVVRSPEGRVLAWNPAAHALYGWPASEAIGRVFSELVETDVDGGVATMEAALASSGRWEGQVTRRSVRAEARVLLVRAITRRGEILEIAQDVTEHHRQRTALERSERRYRNLFGAMAASFWELDFSTVGAMLRELTASGVRDLREHLTAHPETLRAMMRATRVLDVNDQTVVLFGRGDKNELLGSVEPFWPEESNGVFLESLLAAMGGRPSYSQETKLRAIDGREIDALFTASFPAETVARGKVVVGIVDITARKRAHDALERSEHRYRHLFHHMPLALWQLDARGTVGVFKAARAAGVTDLAESFDRDPDLLRQCLEGMVVREVNQPTMAMLGGRDPEDFAGSVARFWKTRPDTFRRAMEARYRGEATFQEETQIDTLDGRVIDVLFAVARPGPSSDPTVSLVGIIDISERMRARQQLTRLQSEAAHAARVSMVGELTASIAHEVNQPLAAIALNAAAATRWMGRPEPDLDEVRALLTRVHADAKRAGAVITRIREMVALRAPVRAEIALDAIVDDALLFLGHELRAQQVVVHREPTAARVLADRVLLQQVVVNLIANAVHAMAGRPEGSRRITVRTELDDTRARMTIDDEGPGIPEADLERIFDAFFTTKAQGMGMGLSICRSILDLFDGKIVATNRASGGASMAIVLPRA